MKILCVDDDQIFRTMFENVLKACRAGDTVVVVGSGEEACALLDKEAFDVLITDLVMPGMSGLEVLAHARSARPECEVIVVTGQGSIESAVEAMRLGARDYITKPPNTEILCEKLATIAELLGRRRETEDYRFAKEQIEHGASCTIQLLETQLNAVRSVIAEVELAASNPASPDIALDRIKHILSNFKQVAPGADLV